MSQIGYIFSNCRARPGTLIENKKNKGWALRTRDIKGNDYAAD